MRRTLRRGLVTAFGGGLALLIGLFVGQASPAAFGSFLTGCSLTLLGFLQPLVFNLHAWVTLGVLGLAFRLHQQSWPPGSALR